jgi:hypothetical protein
MLLVKEDAQKSIPETAMGWWAMSEMYSELVAGSNPPWKVILGELGSLK